MTAVQYKIREFMKDYNIAILGCGTVGSGVAKIITEMKDNLSKRSGHNIRIAKIVDIYPEAAAKKSGMPLNMFVNPKETLSKEEANAAIEEVIADKNIHLVVETIGGDSSYIENIHESVIKAGKHIVSANKALLAKTGAQLFALAEANNVSVGFEASVCGAIPIIKNLTECFTGDDVENISGIMNGTSNFILSNMVQKGISFDEALKEAQDKGYAEANPSLDINGGDAANKLKILIQVAFGIDASKQNFDIKGIEKVSAIDISFAKGINSVIKLICFVQRKNNKLYATVQPMMIHKDLFLSDINGATNAVRIFTKYATENILVGQGAGMAETGSAVVADIVDIARGDKLRSSLPHDKCELRPFEEYEMPFNLIFKVKDVPGVTGMVTTTIGDENININTVGPNIHDNGFAYFSVVTARTPLSSVHRAVAKMIAQRPDVFIEEVKIFPIMETV